MSSGGYSVTILVMAIRMAINSTVHGADEGTENAFAYAYDQ